MGAFLWAWPALGCLAFYIFVGAECLSSHDCCVVSCDLMQGDAHRCALHCLDCWFLCPLVVDLCDLSPVECALLGMVQ